MVLDKQKVVDHLIDEHIISKDVAEIMKNADNGRLGSGYENILTEEDGSPTLFVIELVKLTGYNINEFCDEENNGSVKDKEQVK